MAGSKSKVLTTTPDPALVVKTYEAARDMIVNKLTIPVGKLDAKDLAEVAAKVTATKKNADFTASFDGQWLRFEAVIGTQKVFISSVDVSALGDAAKVFEIKKKLAAIGLASAPVDPAARAAKLKSISDVESVIQSAEGVKQSYTNYTYASDEPAIYGALEKWAASHSRSPYLDFLGDLNAKTNAKKVFDTYIKKGAASPINLSASVAAAIEKDLKAAKAPNFDAAKKEILGVVNTKIVPVFKKETLANIDKGIAQSKKDLATLKAELKAMGAP